MLAVPFGAEGMLDGCVVAEVAGASLLPSASFEIGAVVPFVEATGSMEQLVRWHSAY